MDYVGKSAHTNHGLGTITEVDSVRGSKQFRVAGRGFDVWVPEIRLRLASGDFTAGLETTIEQGHTNDDNSTTLPYDPTPQYPVDMFRKDQTILPGDHEIDPEDRLHPSKSLSKGRADANRPYPGPSPDLFAKGASAHYAEEEPFQGDPYKEWGEDQWHEGLPDGPERTFNKNAGWHEDPMRPQYGVGSPGLARPTQLEYDDPGSPNSVVTLRRDDNHHDYSPGEGRHYRPAGLSERYAYVIEGDDERDPITAFRRDPVEFMQRRAYVLTAGEEDHLHRKFADYDNLLAVEATRVGGFERTAAWTDVRSKAQRLRHEGRVHVKHVTPQHIYATVNGDHGTYDTMIIKGASGAFSGGQAISNWSCDCDWGKWAFQREASYVGRLCSHAYAAYLDMQSHYHKDNKGRFRAASIVDDFKSWAKENNDGHMDRGSMTDFINTCEKRVTKEEADQLYDHLNKNTQVAPERDYDISYTFDNEKAYKTADALRQRPLSLTPDLREVPKGDENQWTDVTEDDRETTGPDQILHFGSLAARLHIADTPAPGPGQPGYVPGAGPPAPGASNSLSGDSHDFGSGGTGDSSMWPALLNPALMGVKPIADFIDRHNVQAHPDLVSGGGQQAQPAGAVQPAAPGAPATSAQGGASSAPGTAQSPFAGQSGKGRGTTTPPAPAGTQQAQPGAKPSQPTWFPKQESTTTNTDPNSPWTENKNQTSLQGGTDYKVQRGDTLADIAQRSGLGGNYQDLAKANGITDADKLDVGQSIKLPGAGGGKMPSNDTFQALSDAGNALDDQGKPKPAAPGQAPDMGVVNNQFKALGDAGNALNDQGQPKASPVGSPPAPPAVPGASDLKTVGPATPPATPQPPRPPGPPNIHSSLAYRLHQAAEGDDDNDDDERRPDTGEAAAMLTRLRNLSEEDPSDHYQNMDDYNGEVRDLVEKLNDAGVDAMPFVAHLHHGAPQGQRKDNDASDGDANFAGQSNPNWADEPFNGSGPDPQLWASDSGSWIDEHERPDFIDVTDAPDGDIIKFNDSRSAPQQGPRHGAARRYADDDGYVGDGMGYFNPDNPTSQDWEEGSGAPFMNEVGHAADEANPLHGLSGGGGGEAGGEAGLAEEAPELLALAASRKEGFSLDAFDRGEFSVDDGPLRAAHRVGGGPTRQVRVDHGARGWAKKAQTYNPPEDFGNNGDPDPASYADPGTGTDVVASFQRSAGALEMMHGGGQGAARPGSLDDFSSSPMVQSMLRTAGRKFSPEEQRMLEAEAHPQGARNLPTDDDLFGTHYLMGL